MYANAGPARQATAAGAHSIQRLEAESLGVVSALFKPFPGARGRATLRRGRCPPLCSAQPLSPASTVHIHAPGQLNQCRCYAPRRPRSPRTSLILDIQADTHYNIQSSAEPAYSRPSTMTNCGKGRTAVAEVAVSDESGRADTMTWEIRRHVCFVDLRDTRILS